MPQTGSSCSHESCYGCITNSESSEEFQKSCLEKRPEFKSNDTTEAIFPVSASIQWRTKIKKKLKSSPESRSDTSTKVLKVSHFSKSLLDEIESKSVEVGKIFDNMKVKTMKSRYLQSKSNQNYSFPRNKMQLESSQKSIIPQISRVVDVVPKPKFPNDYHVPDQTIGIPVKNVSPIRSCQNILLNSDTSNSFDYSKTHSNVQESVLVSNNISSDLRSEPQVIHHPMISGNIPYNNHKKILHQGSIAVLPPKSIPHESVNIPTFNRSVASQQTSSTKRENSERMVKFCNTVTVAVVPVSFLK